jgi:hypothetical protein
MRLPFSPTEFVQVFAAYNIAVWPYPLVAALLGALAIVLLIRRRPWSDRSISAILLVFWSTMAVGYHWSFFSAINKAAYLFGALFLLAAMIFLVEGVIRHRIRYTMVFATRRWVAAALIAYAFAVYPLLGLLLTHPYPRTPLLGVAPCPTTIFTLGVLLLARHPRPLLLAGIPLLWSAVGGSAAFLLQVPQDLGLLAAAVFWLLVSLRGNSATSADGNDSCN